MHYLNIREGIFEERLNRFVARVRLDGREELCHVKNTGRCRELLIPGTEVSLETSQNPDRKTKYDMIAVRKGERWVNVDSQIPNRAVEEWLPGSGLFSSGALIQRERKYGRSRFDLYVEDCDRRAFLEVKGVTLEENGTARFPDAPTQRGVKHLEELVKCAEEGYEAYLIFVIQMKGVDSLEPNWRTHQEFGEALWKASLSGVHILAYDCQVEKDSIWIDQPISVILEENKET